MLRENFRRSNLSTIFEYETIHIPKEETYLFFGELKECELALTIAEELHTCSGFFARNFQLFSSPVETIMKIGQDLMRAIKEMTDLSIVHCDISMDNVVYRQHLWDELDNFQAVLVDFNHSIIPGDQRTSYPKVKMGYCKKSLLSNIGREHDYFSLGIVLSQLTCFIMKEYQSKEDMFKELARVLRDQIDSSLPNRILLELDNLAAKYGILQNVLAFVQQLVTGE